MTQNLCPSRSLLGGCRVQAVRSVLQLQHATAPCRGLSYTPLPPTANPQRDWSRNCCRGFALFTSPCHRPVPASNSHLSSALVVTGYCDRWFTRCLSYDSDSQNQLVQAVEGELKSEPKVKERQLKLLSAITNDVSEPSKELLTKLNCGPKLTGEEMYQLAAAIFQIRKQVCSDVLEIVVPLFECAGELGDNNGRYTYAQLLRTGQGCTPNPSRAAEIFTDLAMKGHPYAQFTLAGMYYGGVGVEQSFVRAFTLYRVSAQNFVPQAYNLLGEMYRHGQGVDEDIDEAVKQYKKGADLGDPLAHLSLAHCYAHGKGVKQSYEEAFQHHLKASGFGNPVALYNVGGHYFAGKGVGLSFEKAAEYYRKAAKLGFTPAQVNLGNMYYNGLGVPKSRQKAKELYRQAAESDKNAKLLLEEVELEEQKEQQEHQNQRRSSEEHEVTKT